MLLNHTLTVALMAAAAWAGSPIVCNLKALNSSERAHHAALGKKLRTATVEKRQLVDGLDLRLSRDSITLAEVADWVAAERRCCPFLDFRITVERESGAIRLALAGRAGVKEFLLSDFD